MPLSLPHPPAEKLFDSTDIVVNRPASPLRHRVVFATGNLCLLKPCAKSFLGWWRVYKQRNDGLQELVQRRGAGRGNYFRSAAEIHINPPAPFRVT